MNLHTYVFKKKCLAMDYYHCQMLTLKQLIENCTSLININLYATKNSPRIQFDLNFRITPTINSYKFLRVDELSHSVLALCGKPLCVQKLTFTLQCCF